MGRKKSARFMAALILASTLLLAASLQVTKAGDRLAAAKWVLPVPAPVETTRRLLGTRRPTARPPAPVSRPTVSPITPMPSSPPPPYFCFCCFCSCCCASYSSSGNRPTVFAFCL
ncbi:hypothetical protein KSP40_PGU022461 [Platanthera guangdongensis]|uniref:Uncharacterized protein n=1 Tax=Platanthera guangdongensis TaxID=2320717 RepID=A0ABR2M5U7_9ASPA